MFVCTLTRVFIFQYAIEQLFESHHMPGTLQANQDGKKWRKIKHHSIMR